MSWYLQEVGQVKSFLHVRSSSLNHTSDVPAMAPESALLQSVLKGVSFLSWNLNSAMKTIMCSEKPCSQNLGFDRNVD